LEADFRTDPGAIVGVGAGVFVVDAAGVGFLDFSLPFSLPFSSSLETTLGGTVARLKWSSSGGNKLVPEKNDGLEMTFCGATTLSITAFAIIDYTGNTKGGSVNLKLTSCLTGLG